MPLIDAKGQPVHDDWVAATEDDAVPAAHAILTLTQLAPFVAQGWDTPRPLGVRVQSTDRVESAAAVLGAVDLVAIEFPKFRDGRGFTMARALREHHAYAGDIRAVGHVLPDQYVFLLQCGFTTVEVPAGQPLERWAEALSGVAGDHPPRARSAQLFGRMVARGV
jgi:uncharacterized protein (DUF934 family)